MKIREQCKKRLYHCPICGEEMKVVKTWLSGDIRKQRVECSNNHRLTLNLEIVPDRASMNRLMRQYHNVQN